MIVDELLAVPPFSLAPAQKDRLLLAAIGELHDHHVRRCPEYARVVAARWPGYRPGALADLPYLPVGLFKSHRLVSVPDDEVVRVLTSSGTTGQRPSAVHVDRETADRQTRALVTIMKSVLGPARLPMLVVDTPAVVRPGPSFSARGVGILGMMNFGRKHTFVLDDDMRLDRAALDTFLEQHGDQPFLVFGFTFMVWRHLVQALAGGGADLSQGVLVHGGGWKALQAEAVGNAEFTATLARVTGLARVHDFYGMVEQVGSVFLEGDDGVLHCPAFADVIVRDPETWAPQPPGRAGVLQVLSALPTSYPGHSLLTEDLGVVHALDAAHPDGWRGTAFSVLGRLPRSELRGCSDTHARAVGA